MSKRKAESVPTELFESIHNLLAAQGYEKAASALLKEASIDKKKAGSADDLASVFAFYKSNNKGAKKPAVVAKKDSSSSDSSSDSDSDDEAPAKKPVPAAAAAKKAAPVKKADSSSDSSSSSEDEAPAKKPVPAAAAAAKKAAPAKKADSSSSDSSSSSSEDEAPAKKPVPAKAAAAAPVKATPVKKAASSSDSSSSDSSSSSSSEDEKPAKPTPAKAAAIKAAAAKKASSSSSSSGSSSDSSSSDEEAPPKKVAKKVEAATPATSKVVSAPSTPSSRGDTTNAEHKIYVKGLPWVASEAEVRDYFSQCGSIVSTECPLDENGRSSGTAFVKFAERAGLEAALALDQQNWPGTERWLKIQEGFDKPERRAFAEVGAKPEGCDTVFVGNLPWDVTEEQMREIFGSAGDISSVRFAQGEDGGFRGFGHVSYYDGSCVDEAIKLAGSDVNGRAIRVDFAPPRNRESFGGGRGAPGGGRGGRGDGGRGRGGPGRGGRGGATTPVSKNKGVIAAGSGKKMTFDE